MTGPNKAYASPGLKLDHPRQLALMHVLVRFSHIAAGSTFTTAEIYPYIVEILSKLWVVQRRIIVWLRSAMIYRSFGPKRWLRKSRTRAVSAYRPAAIPSVSSFSSSSNASTHHWLRGFCDPSLATDPSNWDSRQRISAIMPNATKRAGQCRRRTDHGRHKQANPCDKSPTVRL